MIDLHKKVIRGFVQWLLLASAIFIFHTFYFGTLGPTFPQAALLMVLIALSIIYLGMRALRFGKQTATVILVCWFVTVSVYFGLWDPVTDVRLKLLPLLALGIVANLVLNVVIKFGKPVTSGRQ